MQTDDWFDIGYAADWKISAAYADGESARVVIATTQALRGPCDLKNESGATLAAMESPCPCHGGDRGPSWAILEDRYLAGSSAISAADRVSHGGISQRLKGDALIASDLRRRLAEDVFVRHRRGRNLPGRWPAGGLLAPRRRFLTQPCRDGAQAAVKKAWS
jgi:hypothetical protein